VSLTSPALSLPHGCLLVQPYAGPDEGGLQVSRALRISLGLIVFGTGAATAAVMDPWQSTASIPGSDLLVQGSVAQASPLGGAPERVDRGVVRVSWMPGLAAAEVGEELWPVTVAVAHTDARGRYQVYLTPTAAIERAASGNDGWVSFDVSVTSTDGRAQSVSTPRRLVDGAWVQASPRAAMHGAGEGATRVDPGDEFGALDDVDFTFDAQASSTTPRGSVPAARVGPGRESTEVSYADPLSAGSASSDPAAATGSVPCSFEVTRRPQRSVRVLNWHNAGNSNATWTYGTSADSDLDVAFDGSGDGTWSLRGAFHVGNTVGSTVRQTVKTAFNKYARTSFRWTEGYYKPFGVGGYCNGDPSIPVWSKRKTATTWVAGVANDAGAGAAYQGCSVAPQNGFRTSYPVGSGYKKASTTATRISVAADVGPINIGGSSGYSTELDVSWNSVRGQGMWLCGKRDDLTGAPGVIHAQNR
jgi:hypothetical protein